jgi:hypothetical protein
MDDPLTEFRRYVADHPGMPLGKGAPSGATLRLDGESHRQAWERILRFDPCAFCGRSGGSVDHLEPRDPLVPLRGIGSKFGWMNLSGACEGCNGSKGTQSLLGFLWVRAPRLSRRTVIVRRTRTQGL